MYKKISIVVILFLVSSNLVADIGGILNKEPTEVLKIIDAIRAPETSFISNMEVIDTDATKNKTLIFNLIVGVSGDKSFAIYNSPKAQRGQSILSVGQNIWVYVPKTSNPIKISPQQKLVGQASVADIVSLLYYPNYNVKSYTKSGGNYVLSLQAKNKQVAYNSVDMVVDNNGFPKEAKFYSLSGKSLKTMYFESVKEMLGKKRPTSMRIVSDTNTSLITVVSFKSMEDKKIPNSHFNKEFITKLGGLYLK